MVCRRLQVPGAGIASSFGSEKDKFIHLTPYKLFFSLILNSNRRAEFMMLAMRISFHTVGPDAHGYRFEAKQMDRKVDVTSPKTPKILKKGRIGLL